MRSALVLAAASVIMLFTPSCDPAKPSYLSQVKRMTGGDPKAGRLKIRNYGCHACHTIPGVTGAHALVGPPLTNIASRAYLAGELANTPENMMLWIQHPHAIEQHTVMPEMNVSEDDSRDITAYLYTLR